MFLNNIKMIYVEEVVLGNEITRKILKGLDVKTEIINDIRDIPPRFFDAKETLILAEQKGAFFKKCPCTPNYIGCEYYVVELAVGCLYDCSYCYLQEYQNMAATTFYVNFDRLFQEFDELLYSDQDMLFRIGLGEYSDSLFLDNIIGYTKIISQYLASKHKNYFIEYKTKSHDIERLQEFEPTGKEVIGFSVNPPKVCRAEEKKASSFEQRLEAMKKCEESGYYIAIHFDPVLEYEGWEEGYKYVIDSIYNIIPAGKIIWISIGSLRFNARLKPIISYRHPESKIIYNEMIKGADGKLRYIKSLRLRLYKKIVEYLRSRDKDSLIYFCMEDQEIWDKVLNKKIESSNEVYKLFGELRSF